MFRKSLALLLALATTALLLSSCNLLPKPSSSSQVTSSSIPSSSSQPVSVASSSKADPAPQVVDAYAGSYLYKGTEGQDAGYRTFIPKITPEKPEAAKLNADIAAKLKTYKDYVLNKSNNGQKLTEVTYTSGIQSDHLSIIVSITTNNYPGTPNFEPFVYLYDYKNDKIMTTADLLTLKKTTSAAVFASLKAKVEASNKKSRVTESDWADWLPPISTAWLSQVQTQISSLKLWYENGALWLYYVGETELGFFFFKTSV